MRDEPIDLRKAKLKSVDSYLFPQNFNKSELEGVLISSGEIESRINKMRLKIFGDYEKKQLYVLTILKGSSTFREKIFSSEHHAINHEYGFIHVSSYVGKKSLEIKLNSDEIKNLLPDIRGKHVLIIEDIIDTGKTIFNIYNELKNYKKEFNIKSIKICALLDKRSKRLSQYSKLKIHYLGFIIPDVFVVGYGLDYDDKYRFLPHICVLK